MGMKDIVLGIVVVVFSVGVSWGITTERISSVEARVLEVEVRLDKKDDQFLQLQKDIAGISINIEWIKKRLEESYVSRQSGL